MLEYGKLLISSGRDGIGYIKAAADEKMDEALIYMYDHELKAGNGKQAYAYAKELHIKRNRQGTRFLADCYLNGVGVKRDKSLAKDLYREAGE
jgi:TPR repeat protein